MASLLKLKTDIKKLKAAIASKATSGTIKTKLRGKLTTLENELDKLQPNKRKPKTTGPKSESALVKLAKKRRTNQGLSTSKSDIERDAIRPAKKAGKRISANGNRYYEYRDNRVDNRQPPKKYRKLADGGMMADKGTYVTSGFTTTDELNNTIVDKFKMQDWYEDFNDGFEKLLTKKYITQQEYEKYEEILNRVDPIDKYGEMSGRAAAKKFVDDNKRYTKMADGGEVGDDYRKKLVDNIVKAASNKEVNGFEFVKEGWRNYGFLLWANKQRPEIEIYATPFYTPDNDINFEEFINEEGARREDKAYKLTGDLDKDTEYYFNYLESKTKKYAKGKMADGGMVVLDTEEDKEDYANDLKDFILEKYIGKSVLGFKLTDEAYDGETPWTWKLKKKKIDVLAEPFVDSYDEGITIEAYENEDEPIGQRDSVDLELTGNFDKDADKYLELVKPYLQKYASGNYSKGGYMAKGGKTKEQEVVRGYFEDEAYEYADGGMVEKLRKEFSTKELDDNLMLDGYKTEVFDYTEEKEAKRWVKNNSKDNYVVPYENYDDNYIFVLVPKNKMADGGSVAKGNYEMLMSQAKEVMHHAEELMQVAKPDMDVEAWVVAKAERATTDLSDITHYLDGLKMAMGGMVKHNAHKVNA
jgi:hypothetical protein